MSKKCRMRLEVLSAMINCYVNQYAELVWIVWDTCTIDRFVELSQWSTRAHKRTETHTHTCTPTLYMNHIKWQIFCCCWPNMCGLWSNCWLDRLPCGRSMKAEERGGEGGRRRRRSAELALCLRLLVANCFNRKPQFQSVSRSDPKSDRTEPKRDAMWCAALCSAPLERTIDRSSASKYRFRPYLMINIGNRTYLNLPVIIIVSACSCICISCCICICSWFCVARVCCTAATTLATDRGNMSDGDRLWQPPRDMRHFCSDCAASHGCCCCCCCCLNKF